jgi:hypothetical protein
VADEESLPFADAVGIVSRDRNVTRDEAGALLRAAIARNELRTDTDHQLAAALKSRISLQPTGDPGIDVLRESAAQGYLANELHRNPRVNKADLENWLRPQAVPEELLKFANRSTIEDAITAVYDIAEETKVKPPNIKELVKPVQSRLEALGYKPPSGRQIMKIAGAEKFAKRRGESGKRVN